MAKVRTFSRRFLKGHPKEGQPTYFVEKVWNGLKYLGLSQPKWGDFPIGFLTSISPLIYYGKKYHTIRAGKHFKAGDFFSPRVWTDKPYSSKQITIAPDLNLPRKRLVKPCLKIFNRKPVIFCQFFYFFFIARWVITIFSN